MTDRETGCRLPKGDRRETVRRWRRTSEAQASGGGAPGDGPTAREEGGEQRCATAGSGYAFRRSGGGQVRERAGAYYQQGREKAVDYEQRIEEMVREQPMKSVLIAAGAGLVLGMLLRRR